MAELSELERQLQKLKQVYIKALPDKKQELQEAIDAVNAAETDPDRVSRLNALRGIAHKLSGSGATYGFKDLGLAARALENFCDLALEADPTLATFSNEDFMGVVDTLLAEIQIAEKGDEDRQSLPPCAAATPVLPEDDQIKVLIAESNQAARDQLIHDLGTFGLDVRAVDQLADLEKVFSNFIPDIILLDFDFPNQPQNGAQVLMDLRARDAIQCPVVFYADRDDLDARLAAVRAGCSAYLLKPASAPKLIELVDQVLRHEDPKPYRILVVDDDPSTARYSEVILSGHNMIVEVLTDPMKIMESLVGFAPELILMDLYMPGCNGIELSEVIRQQDTYAGIPIVFLSGEADKEKQIRAMNAGGDDFLTKPIAADQLVSAVRIRVQRFRTLRSQMVSDSLTGLYNHTTTRQFLDKEIGRAEREKSTVCFLMLDIDHFKSVNDTYGHPVGDRVILSLSRLLRQRLRGSDVIGRLGGEEFGVILPVTPMSDAMQIANEIRMAFFDIRFDAEDKSFQCSISIGVSCYPDFKDVAGLIEAADQALYEAKNGGRNQVCRAKAPDQ